MPILTRNLFLLLALTSCAAHDVRKATDGLIGRTSSEVDSCMGIPDKVSTEKDGRALKQWAFKPSGNSTVTLPLSALALFPLTEALNISGNVVMPDAKSCIATAEFQDDRMTRIGFTGDVDGIVGRDGNCRPLVIACLRSLTLP